MTGSFFGRSAVIVAAIAAVFATPAPPASAIQSINDPLGATVVNIQFGHTVSHSIRVTPIPTSLNGYSVSAVCTAAASPDPSSTAVEVCTVNGVGIGSRVSLPGPTSVATTVVTAFAGTVAWACVQGSAQFVESALGPASITNPKTCHPVYLP